MVKFKLIHRETGLTLRQYKAKYPLRIHTGTLEFTDQFKDKHVKYMIRDDGAIAIQRLNKDLWYGDTEQLFFLKREDWIIEWNG